MWSSLVVLFLKTSDLIKTSNAKIKTDWLIQWLVSSLLVCEYIPATMCVCVCV